MGVESGVTGIITSMLGLRMPNQVPPIQPTDVAKQAGNGDRASISMSRFAIAAWLMGFGGACSRRAPRPQPVSNLLNPTVGVAIAASIAAN